MLSLVEYPAGGQPVAVGGAAAAEPAILYHLAQGGLGTDGGFLTLAVCLPVVETRYKQQTLSAICIRPLKIIFGCVRESDTCQYKIFKVLLAFAKRIISHPTPKIHWFSRTHSLVECAGSGAAHQSGQRHFLHMIFF